MYSKLEDNKPGGADGKQLVRSNKPATDSSIPQSNLEPKDRPELSLYDKPDELQRYWADSNIQLTFGVSDQRSKGDKMYCRKSELLLFVVVAIVAAAVGIGLGVIIGWFSKDVPENSDVYDAWVAAVAEADEGVTEMIVNELEAANMKHFLRELTDIPHLAGTAADRDNAEYVKSLWDEQGLDSAKIMSYNVLLSYPDADNPNFASILNQDNSTFFRSDPEEAELEQGDRHPDAVTPFSAYSPAGVVFGDLVYVNYATIEDFQKLEELGISVEGKIVLARYGRIFRGDKEFHANQYGAIGMILYSDPYDYAVDGESNVYPNTWYLPGTGIQRGTLFRGVGDPLTPAYPATDDAYRDAEEDVGLPNLPVQPIGYANAKIFLQELVGNTVPEGWAGAISDVNYTLGPGLRDGRKVKLEVYNYNERRTIHNVFGMIKGSIEPDRYVILGNHRDAWVFGSVDPSSGTAVMMELSRVMGKLYKEGKWQPRRSILFCSWGAEEYALIGSTEWVEEFAKTVGERTLAYLNVDISVQGNHTFRVKGTPSLFQATYDATKRVPDAPLDGHSSTVFDTWLERYADYDNPELPFISDIGSGSDYSTLLRRYGIPAVDLRYTYDPNLPISSYPLYHSMYETYFLVSEIMDPTFECHLAVGRVWGEMARNLADSLIIPMSSTDYHKRIVKAVDELKELFLDRMTSHGITFDSVDSAVEAFGVASTEFESSIISMDKTNPFAVRKVNDQIMLLERAFLDPLGLPDRPLDRHVVFAPSSKDQYKGDAFPGILDLMFDIDETDEEQWEKVKKHMSVIAYTLRSAASTLMEVDVLAN